MSVFDASGSTFYSQTNPENVEQVAPSQEPEKPKYAAQDADSFAPSSGEDPIENPQPVPGAQPSMLSLPLIAAGLFALWLMFKGDE